MHTVTVGISYYHIFYSHSAKYSQYTIVLYLHWVCYGNIKNTSLPNPFTETPNTDSIYNA